MPIFQESGFYYQYPSIPIDQLTITHSEYFPFKASGDASSVIIAANRFIEESSLSNTKVCYSLNHFKVGNNYFSVIKEQGVDFETKRYFASVDAITQIHGNTIHFKYIRNSNDSFNTQPYYDSIMPLIQTITLSEPM